MKLAEILCSQFPPIERVRFTSSGTEAVMFAIRLARNWSGRDKVMLFRGDYHGAIDRVLLVDGSISAGFLHSVTNQLVMAQFNNVEATQQLSSEHRQELAGVVFEPTLGTGGVVKGTIGFAKMLRDMCMKCGILLVADEIFPLHVGNGGICAERFGILPDLVSLGKMIGAHFPLIALEVARMS